MNNIEKLKLFLRLVQQVDIGRCVKMNQEYIYREIYDSLRGRFQPLGLKADGEVHISICSGCKGDEGSKLTCQNSAPVIDNPREYTYLAFGLTIGIAVL